MGFYKYIGQLWKRPKKNFGKEAWRDRLIGFRQDPAILRIDKPTRLDRARLLGFKAKQGYFVVRSRVPKGARRRPTIKGGRRPKRYGLKRFTAKKSDQWISEERAARKYPNAEVLNSYWIGEDGKYTWFELVMVDRDHPVIQKNKNISWIAKQKGRTHRGLTSAGKKSRGLVRGSRVNTVKNRPSIRANKRLGK